MSGRTTNFPRLTLPLLILALAASVRAEVRLPSIIGDNMVLQQGMKVSVWGNAGAGEHVTVTFDKKSSRQQGPNLLQIRRWTENERRRSAQGFAIAGEDHRFLWADAYIEGDTVIVSSPTILKPVAVRYGWADNPVVNLYNRADLAASPFRTDGWPGVTATRR